MNGDASLNGQGVVPLRTILTNFLNLVETYETRRNGGLDSYDSEFQELKQFSENLKTDPDHVCREGEKSTNRKKNRYKDILPFDCTRVILSDHGDVAGSDYINANYIKGASGSSAYIASQGPLPHTVNDFWRMVVECEVQVIVMACNEQESGKHKCESYWVEDDGVEREFGGVTVWLKKCRQVCPDFLLRTMRIRFINSRGEKEERNVCQFHYSAWPDHGVPSKVRPLLDMVRRIRDQQTSETLPVLVHCSAGCGRTGTICAIDYVFGLLRLGRLTPEFSLFTLVREMRKQRIAMVQTKDQYVLVHRAVKELFQEQLKIIDSHPYANVDENGLPFDMKKHKDEPTYETLDFLKSSLPFVSKNSSDLNNSEIVISVSNINVDANNKLSTSHKASPPTSSSSSAGTNSLNLTSSKINTSNSSPKTDKVKEISTKTVKSDGTKNAVPEDSVNLIERDVSFVKEKKSGSVTSENEQSKSSNPLRAALLRKPSIVKLKSLFEKNSKDDKSKKPGQLHRAKSDVSSRFYPFNTFSAFGSSSSSQPASDNHKSAEDNQISSNMKSGDNTKDVRSSKKPPLFTKPILPIKRSKSLKVSPESAKQITSNHGNGKTKKKLTEQRSNSGSVSSSNPSTSSSTFSSNLSDNPIKVCVKQVEIPKLQTIVSKSVKPEVQMATTHEYDYDIDDRSHLRQKPINPVVLQRETFQKSLEPQSGNSKETETFEETFKISKPVPPSRIHISRDKHNYANVAYENGAKSNKTILPKEMEDLHNFKSSKNYATKYDKLKKCDTVNPRLLASSFGFTPKYERTSLTRSQSHVWQPDKVVMPIRIFSDENIHQSTNHVERGELVNSGSREETQSDIRNGVLPLKAPLEVGENGKVFVQAVQSDSNLKQFKSGEEYSGNRNDSGMASSTENLLMNQSKPIIRRRVPKTNPYANYPSCITGNNNFPYKVTTASGLPEDLARGEASRYNKEIPNLKTSNGGGSAGNSSDSSSNTATPRNSLPSTPTQSVDVLYPQTYRVGATGVTSKSSQIPRANGLNLSTPKSILKDPFLIAPPGDSEDKVDTSRYFPPVSSNSIPSQVPKINTIRIAVGVRERRNSFRQAVWKEAQPPLNHDFSSGDQVEVARNVQPTYSSNPFKASSNGIMDPSKTRNYEPIWPDANSAPNQQINFYSTPPYSHSLKSGDGQIKTDWKLESIKPVPISSSFKKPEATSQLPNSSALSKQRYEEQQAFKHKVDEIQVMLAELNAPSEKQNSSTSNASSSSLKQQRSLRAPSRSQYQQGLSCFTFRKPSSFESVVEQLQLEDDQRQSLLSNSYSQTLEPRGKIDSNTRNIARGYNGGRSSNDYVTLQQCRTMADTSAIPSLEHSKTNHFMPASPEMHRKLNGVMGLDATPVPPPRTKKNHYMARRDSCEFDTGQKREDSSSNIFPSQWPASNVNSSMPNERPGMAMHINSLMNSSNKEVNDNFENSSPEERGSTSTSPKAIIKALGLFQAKAANVRSRFTNWAEAKDKNLTKRLYENGNGLPSEKETSPVNSDYPGPGPGSSLPPATNNHVPLGSLARSKHQYL